VRGRRSPYPSPFEGLRSWSPNHDIVISETIGRLSAGDYVLNAAVQPWPAEGNPVRAIARGIAFTVVTGGPSGGT